MTYRAYVERQKEIIKSRRGEFEEAVCEEVRPESEKLFKDLCTLKGLNTTERMKIASKA